MLRLLILTTLFPDASRPNFGIFAARQARALAARDDVEVHVVAPLGLPPRPLDRIGRYQALAALPERECWDGLPVLRPRFLNLPLTGGRFHAPLLARALLPTLRTLRETFPFDLIHADFFFPDGVAAVALGAKLGVPVTIQARGSDIHRWAHRPGPDAQIRRAGAAADGLIAVSEAMRDDLIALGMPAGRARCIVAGVDLARFGERARAEAKAALGVSGPLIVSLGALIPLKGHDLVIDAVARLPGVRLWIAGEGPDRAALEQRIAQAGLGDRVRLLGGVPHEEVATVLAAADVMALASEREGLASAWLEALAAGTPLVIPDVGGARQVVTDVAAGRIVPRTVDAFAEALAALLADPPTQAAVRATVAGYGWEANATALRAFFVEAMAWARKP